MVGTEIPAELKVEHLLHNVQQLSPTELDEFTQKFTEWQHQRKTAIDEKVDNDASDDEVIAFIRKNSQLPQKENQRYWQLRNKREDETLNDGEQLVYEELLRQLEVMNVKRLEALVILVQRWQKPAEDIMAELGLVISKEITIGEDVDPDASDAEVIAFIRKNSQLPEKENRRYWELRRMSDDETLSDEDRPEYRELVRRLTVMTAKRLDALAILVQRWQKPVEDVMAELGLVILKEITIGEDVDPDASDAEVLASIRANLLLPEKENRRYWELRHKSDEETLSDTELPEYQELVRLLTILNTKRIEGIAVLVKRWGKSAEEIIREFGLKAGNDVSCLDVN